MNFGLQLNNNLTTCSHFSLERCTLLDQEMRTSFLGAYDTPPTALRNHHLSDHAVNRARITHKTIIPTNHTTHSRHDCGPSHESSGPDGILKPLSDPSLNFSHAVMTIQNLKLQLTQPRKSNQKKTDNQVLPQKPGFNQLSL